MTLPACRAFALLAASALLAGCGRAPSDNSTPDAAPIATQAFPIVRSDVTATLQAGQPITVDNPYGDVHARFGGFAHGAEVHLVLQEPKGATHIALQPRLSDGVWVIAPRLPQGATIADDQRLDLSVLVPEGHALRVRTGSGLIDVHGVHGDVDVHSDSGDISLRGIRGAIQAETGEGGIEASLDTAPRGARQRLATTTGSILVGIDDHLDAGIDMATSAQFATDYSLDIRRTPGEEPDKHAHTVIGANASHLALDSRRGEIRLVRRSGFTTVGGPDAGHEVEQQQDEDNDSD